MQTLDLKVLDLEVPYDRPSDRQPTYRQCADGAGAMPGSSSTAQGSLGTMIHMAT
jgi:hypothetical protein